MVVPAASQYATDANLAARQRLWRHQEPSFDLLSWVIELADLTPAMTVLDLGCGNGAYLPRVVAAAARVVGADRSMGMLGSIDDAVLVNADAVSLPFADCSFEVVLAAHMLYHVSDLTAAISEIRRVLASGGTCLAVTNGEAHIASLRRLVEAAAAESTPGWEMRDPAAVAFSLENGAAPLLERFESVECVRPPVASKVIIDDPAVVADYVASVADHYQPQVDRPWVEIVEDCRQTAETIIDREGQLVTAGDVGVLICR